MSCGGAIQDISNPARLHMRAHDRNRQADDVRIGPVDAGHKPGCEALNGIGASLVARLCRGDIPFDFGVVEGGKLDRCDRNLRGLPPPSPS